MSAMRRHASYTDRSPQVKTMKIEVIVFDLYNTLIEIKKKRNSFGHLYRNCHLQRVISFSDFINLVLTKDLKEIIDLLPSKFEFELEKQSPKFEEELNSIVTYQETYSVLSKLSEDYPLFLISNLASIYKRPFYDLNLSNWFEKAFFSCDLLTFR